MKPAVFLSLCCLILLCWPSSGRGAGDAIGLVTRLCGPGTLGEGHADETISLVPFMKLYEADTLILAAETEIQIIFFKNGRKETWHGPVQITLEPDRGRTEGPAVTQPRVLSMPDSVAREVRRISRLVDPSRLQTSGATMVRGDESEDSPDLYLPPPELDSDEKREIRLAKTMYESMAETAPAGDITPELFLFSVLADFDQFGDMAVLINVMETKQPENSLINELRKWMENQK